MRLETFAMFSGTFFREIGDRFTGDLKMKFDVIDRANRLFNEVHAEAFTGYTPANSIWHRHVYVGLAAWWYNNLRWCARVLRDELDAGWRLGRIFRQVQ